MAPTLGDRLAHILEAIAKVQELLSVKTVDDFEHDPFGRLALERLLEIVSEASRWIPPEMKAKEAQIN